MKHFLTLSLVFAAGIMLAQAPSPGSPNKKGVKIPPPSQDGPVRITPLTPGQPPGIIRKPIGTIVPAPANLVQPAINSSSLLKVNVTYQSYNLQIPWQKESAGGRRGLGIVLAKNRVLVTAQMVADSTYIEFELPDSGQKLPAKVEAVDYEANLALLAPNSPAREKDFFAGLTGVQLDTTARIGDALSVWQSGRVGDLIVTPMRISKVMTQGYFVENAAFLVYEATGIIRSESNSFTLPVVRRPFQNPSGDAVRSTSDQNCQPSPGG